MACSYPEDNESSYFVTASDGCSTNLDLFDFGFSYPNADASDASTSTDTNFFDDISSGSISLDGDTCADVFPSIAETLSRFIQPNGQSTASASAPVTPKSQRLVHRMRPEGVAISSAQLLALENKDSTPITAFRQADHWSPPETPPATPQHHRTHPTTPSTKDSYRMHRAEKQSGHSRPSSRPAQQRTGSLRTMSPTRKKPYQQTPSSSPSFAEWTERLRLLAVQSPPIDHSLPISPPPSTKVNQTELKTTTILDGLGLDIPDDIFGLSSSTTTATDSTDSKYPSIEDIHSSTTGLSSWDLDGGAELFGIKSEPWDFSASDSVPSGIEFHCLSNVPQTTYQHDDSGHANFGTSTDGGLGIIFGGSEFDSQVFGSTVEPMDTPFPASVKLPAMPFNTPSSEFGSPLITSNLSSFSTNALPHSSPRVHARTKSSTASSPTKHRRSKSSTSFRGAHRSARETGTGKVSGSRPRNPRMPKNSGSASGGMGFVNFTPEDRNRILTGVAPSGSSKTKARREKEALERRRKLSEAARRLVSEAGGDVDAVDRELSE